MELTLSTAKIPSLHHLSPAPALTLHSPQTLSSEHLSANRNQHQWYPAMDQKGRQTSKK